MAIPKIIHFMWFGGAELPEKVLKCMESWKRYCPDYEIKRWDESNYDYHQYQYAEEAYAQKKWAFVSDVARLDVVYKYGGIYLDTDVELIKPLDSLLNEKGYMAFEQGRQVATGLGFGAEKGNYLVGKNLEAYRNRPFVLEDGSLDLTPCPVITTTVLEQYGLQKKDTLQFLESMTIFPTEYCSPMILFDGSAEITENTISIHHYEGSWTTTAEKNAVMRRRWVYTKFGKKGLRVYDGLVLLKTHGWQAFWCRCKEIISEKSN